MLGKREGSPLGLVLSGGGARGLFQVGVWDVLYSSNDGFEGFPDVISGTSAGALNGSLIAAGLTPRQILDFWLSLAEEPPVVANRTFFSSFFSATRQIVLQKIFQNPFQKKKEIQTIVDLFRKHAWYMPSGFFAMLLEYLMTAQFESLSLLLDSIQTSYLFQTGLLQDRLKATLGGSTLPLTDVKLAINTMDIRSGGVVRIVNHKPTKSHSASSTRHYLYEPRITLDMIIASASIPLLFNPIQVGEHQLWDGGILVNTPLAPAVALGAKRIVPVLVTLKEVNPAVPIMQTLGSGIERLADAFLENAYNIDRKLLLERNRLAHYAPELNLIEVELFRPIRPTSHKIFNAGSYLFFEREAMLRMYEAGRQAGREWLSQGPLLDERNLES